MPSCFFCKNGLMDFRQPEQAALRETLIPSIPPLAQLHARGNEARVEASVTTGGGKKFSILQKTEKKKCIDKGLNLTLNLNRIQIPFKQNVVYKKIIKNKPVILN